MRSKSQGKEVMKELASAIACRDWERVERAYDECDEINSELLEALKRAKDVLEEIGFKPEKNEGDFMEEINEAIAKAEGRLNGE